MVDKSVNIAGGAVGSTVITGDRNKVKSTGTATSQRVTLPAANSVDIATELNALRALLLQANDPDAGKIGRALDDAAEESAKEKPDKDEVGNAINRALGYAEKGEKFVDLVEKISPHLINAVGWLGSNWTKLLPLVGLVI